MKALGFSILFIWFTLPALQAQVRVYDPGKVVERNVEYRTNSKIDQGIDKGLDKVEEGVMGRHAQGRRSAHHCPYRFRRRIQYDFIKKRVAAVKAELASTFGVDANRMETDGRGESQPAGPNTTLEGKANNRRVEFVKL